MVSVRFLEANLTGRLPLQRTGTTESLPRTLPGKMVSWIGFKCKEKLHLKLLINRLKEVTLPCDNLESLPRTQTGSTI